METPSCDKQTPATSSEPSVFQPSNIPVSDVTLDQYTKIWDRAYSEIEHVRSVYKWLAGSLGLILAAAIGAATFLTYNSFRDMRSDLDSKADQLSHRVDKRIDEEFSKANIRDLIQKKAEERIDKIADGIIRSHINRSLEPRLAAFESKLTDSDYRVSVLATQLAEKITATDVKLRALESGALAELRETSDYVMTAVAAQNDDRKAFDQLRNWAQDKSSPFQARAAQARDKVLDEHATLLLFGGFATPWSEGDDPSKLSFDQVKTSFRSAPPDIRVALLKSIQNRKDIPQGQKMTFFVEVMRTDASLKVVEFAGRFLTRESGQKIKPLAIDQLLQWWEIHKTDYGDKAQSGSRGSLTPSPPTTRHAGPHPAVHDGGAHNDTQE